MRLAILNLTARRWRFAFLLLLLFSSLLLVPGTTSASETQQRQTATVEMTELDRLDSIFSQLSQANGKLQNELTDSRAELLKSQEALKKAQQELRMLQLQIAELKALSENQENSLQKVNESFKQYAAETKRQRVKIKAQRNMWATAFVLACVGFAIK